LNVLGQNAAVLPSLRGKGMSCRRRHKRNKQLVSLDAAQVDGAAAVLRIYRPAQARQEDQRDALNSSF